MKDIYSAAAWTDPRAWDVLVELARAIVTLADRDKGENSDYARATVSDWGARIPDASNPDAKLEMRHVLLELSLPRALVDAALAKAGILEHDDKLGTDQEIWANQIEME